MNQKKLVLYTTLAIIACVILIIIALIVVWTPNEGTQVENIEGRKQVYSYIENTNFKQKTYNTYISEVKRLLMPVNVKQLYKKLNEDYISENNLTEDNLGNFLNEKKLLSNQINFKSYTVVQKGDIYIYRIIYDTLNQDTILAQDCVVNIIEEKPFAYTLSFENESLSILEHNITRRMNDIEIQIKNIENKKESAKFEITFTNHNEEDVTIDFDDINNVLLVLNNGKQIRMAATIISAEDDILTKGSSLKKEAFFSANIIEQGMIKAIKFEKIKIGDKETSITVDF